MVAHNKSMQVLDTYAIAHSTEAKGLLLKTLKAVKNFVASAKPSARQNVTIASDVTHTLLQPSNRTLLTTLGTLAKDHHILLQVKNPTAAEIKALSHTFCPLDVVLNKGNIVSLAHLYPLKNLEKLSVVNLQNPDALQRFKNLKSLGIANCARLHTLDILQGFKHLKTLVVVGCDNLNNLDSVQECKNLQILSVLLCDHLKSFAGVRDLKNLQTFIILGCNNFRSFAGIQGLTGLKTLIISSCKNLQTLEGIQGCTNLQSLSIEFCQKFFSLHAVANLNNLETLSLSGCINLQSLAGTHTLTNLKTLHLKLLALESLSDLGGLVNLRKIVMDEMVTMDIMPLLRCPDLVEMKITRCDLIPEKQMKALYRLIESHRDRMHKRTAIT